MDFPDLMPFDPLSFEAQLALQSHAIRRPPVHPYPLPHSHMPFQVRAADMWHDIRPELAHCVLFARQRLSFMHALLAACEWFVTLPQLHWQHRIVSAALSRL